MFNQLLITVFVGSFVTFFVCLPLIHLLKKFGVVDIPNERSSHSKVTVRGGGLSIIAGLCSTISLFGKGNFILVVMLTTLMLALVSFIDDLKSVPARVRLLVQCGCAIFVLISMGGQQGFTSISVGTIAILSPPFVVGLAMLTMVGYTNAFNFMDGINGLAAIQGIITGFSSALLFYLCLPDTSNPIILLSLAIGSSSLGFLPFNFPHARAFMGDVSSAPLGFLSGTIIVWGTIESQGSLFIPLMLIHGNFLMDTGITLILRIMKGEAWYTPHRDHFYQKLIRSGLSHTCVTTINASLLVVACTFAILYPSISTLFRIVLISVTIIAWSIYLISSQTRHRNS